MAGLSEFMDAHTSTGSWYSSGFRSSWPGRRSRLRLADSGPASRRITAAARSPELSEQVLASLFWWCYVRSEMFRLDSRGMSSSPAQQQVIVSHAKGTRYDLLLLAPDVGETFEVPASGLATNTSAQRGSISEVALEEAGRMQRMLARAGIEVDARTAILAVAEVSNRADFRLVVARTPNVTPTEAQLPAEATVRPFTAPIPALSVSVSNDPRPLATAGVIGSDGSGRLLAITALHAVEGDLDKTAQILVGDLPARIVGRHKLTDSCLLSVFCLPGNSTGQAGLPGFAPQSHRPATFDGAASGHKQTMIRGYDLSVLDLSPYLSSKVYTEPDTVPGDSGSALVDSEDHILGFAVSRTALGAPLEFSTWSWAQQVLDAHGLA